MPETAPIVLDLDLVGLSPRPRISVFPSRASIRPSPTINAASRRAVTRSFGSCSAGGRGRSRAPRGAVTLPGPGLRRKLCSLPKPGKDFRAAIPDRKPFFVPRVRPRVFAALGVGRCARRSGWLSKVRLHGAAQAARVVPVDAGPDSAAQHAVIHRRHGHRYGRSENGALRPRLGGLTRRRAHISFCGL